MERKLKAKEMGGGEGGFPPMSVSTWEISEMRRENGAFIAFFKIISIYLLFV